jgi:hypothetical protein
VDVPRCGTRATWDRQYWVADELAGAVVGDVAAPVYREQLCTYARRVHEHVLRLGPETGGVDVGVFEQQEPVVSLSAGGPQRSLEGVRVTIGNAWTEPAKPQHPARQ